jgi:CubicO group peptidase (beta-lactamase class C family)
MKKQPLLSIMVFTLLLTSCSQPAASPTPYDRSVSGVYPGEVWQEATTPEQLGWSSEKLAKAREYSERIGSAAVMIVDDGVVVDAWGDITRNYLCHSVRKSLLSALYGIYAAEGEIDISKTLQELGIDDYTPLTEAEKQATVADLLRARSGVYIPAAGEAPAMKAMRPERGSHAPGTFWYYNNWDFNALGTIFDQETGEENIYQAFKTRIADPIGMQDYPIEDLQYYYEPYSMHPYYGFRMSARDLARFALLFLREGRWQGQQIIPADWVRESTATYSETGPDSGYGYMWWTGVKGGLFPNVEVKEHSYYASGWGGHEAIVLPYRKLVIVHRVNTDEAGQSVDTNQIGVLLWLILDAAGEMEIGESPFIESAKGVRLTADNLHETLAGSTARDATSAGELVVSFGEDGTMTVSVAGALIDTGTWWAEGNKLCIQFTNPDLGGSACYSVVLDGTTIKLFDLHGGLEMKFELNDTAFLLPSGAIHGYAGLNVDIRPTANAPRGFWLYNKSGEIGNSFRHQ